MVEIKIQPDGNPSFTHDMYTIDQQDIDIILERFFAQEGEIHIILYFAQGRREVYEYCLGQCADRFGLWLKYLGNDYDPLENRYEVLIEKEWRSKRN